MLLYGSQILHKNLTFPYKEMIRILRTDGFPSFDSIQPADKCRYRTILFSCIQGIYYSDSLSTPNNQLRSMLLNPCSI